jgi:hypothetical protein
MLDYRVIYKGAYPPPPPLEREELSPVVESKAFQ